METAQKTFDRHRHLGRGLRGLYLGWGGLIALAVLLVAACGGARHHDQPKSDPPLLVPWHRIGDISLGEPRSRVEAEYGAVGHGLHMYVRNGDQGYYVLRGSRVELMFENGRVEQISFGTPYYRTKSGFGVGSKIPFGSCVTTWTHRCGHVWHGFVWNEVYKEQPCECWVKVGLGNRSMRPTVKTFGRPWFFIDVQHGRVSGFTFATKYVD